MILIIANHKTANPELEKILLAAKEQKLKVDVAFWKEMLYFYDSNKKQQVFFDINGKLKSLKEYDSIYLRADAPIEPDTRNIIAREAKRLGKKIIGTIPDIGGRSVYNKADSTHFCSLNFGAVFPQTFFGHYRVIYNHFNFIKQKIGSPLVFKPNGLSKGSGVEKITNKEQFLKCARDIKENFGKRKSYFIVQKFIPNQCDFRILVLGNKTFCMKRSSGKKDEFRNNFSLGGKVEKVDLPANMKKQAVKIAKTLGLDFAGIDLLKYKNKYIYLEVNKSPGLSGISLAHDKNLFAEVVKYIK